ncbi:hypothetical protein HMPREF9695_02693 [Afipia broomeae ATCC 49717]|uniref:Uncharacterized protein n=1 Tax=Afipia broomeae ATCC 49717 TaxID=883078 RepID=K8P9L6_9BRAD|nr:hypothetical protein HMPREF9695_02693 [Afipia broomeae ATCC 49717]
MDFVIPDGLRSRPIRNLDALLYLFLGEIPGSIASQSPRNDVRVLTPAFP